MNKMRGLFGLFKSRSFLALAMAGNGFLLAAVTVVYFLERNSNPSMARFFDALWWGVTTITTVGYGDVVPHTLAARWIGLFLMYTGTVLFVSFTSIVAAFLIRTDVGREILPLEQEVRREVLQGERIEKSLREIAERLDRLEGQR